MAVETLSDPQVSVVTSSLQDEEEKTRPRTKGGTCKSSHKKTPPVGKVNPWPREGAPDSEGSMGEEADGMEAGGERPRPKLFSWLAGFTDKCRSIVGIRSYDQLDRLMGLYERQVSQDVKECYRKRNRASKLKGRMKDHLNLFYMLYMDVLRPIHNDQFLTRMTRLLSFYMDLELKASRRGKESPRMVSRRLTSILFILLGNSITHIMEAVVESKLFGKKYDEICLMIMEKLQKKLLEAKPIILEHAEYVKYILMYRKWKKMVAKGEQREEVCRMASQCVPPTAGFMDEYYRGRAEWLALLPNVAGPLPLDRFALALVRGAVKAGRNMPEVVVVLDSPTKSEVVIRDSPVPDPVSEPTDTDHWKLFGDVSTSTIALPSERYVQHFPYGETRCFFHLHAIWSELTQLEPEVVDCPLDDDLFLRRLEQDLDSRAAGRRAGAVAGRRRSHNKDSYEPFAVGDEEGGRRLDWNFANVKVKLEPEEVSAGGFLPDVPIGRVKPSSPDRVPPLGRFAQLPVEKIPPVGFSDRKPADVGSPERVPPVEAIARVSSSDDFILIPDSPDKISDDDVDDADPHDVCLNSRLQPPFPDPPVSPLTPPITPDHVALDNSDARVPLVGSSLVLPLSPEFPNSSPADVPDLIDASDTQDAAGAQSAEPVLAMGAELVLGNSVGEAALGVPDQVTEAAPDSREDCLTLVREEGVPTNETLVFESPAESAPLSQPAAEVDPLLTNPPISSADEEASRFWNGCSGGGNGEEIYPDRGDLNAAMMYEHGGQWVPYEDLVSQYQSDDFNNIYDLYDNLDSNMWPQSNLFMPMMPLDNMFEEGYPDQLGQASEEDPDYMKQTTQYWPPDESEEQPLAAPETEAPSSPPLPYHPPSPQAPRSPADRRKGKRGPKKRQEPKANKVEEYIATKNKNKCAPVEEPPRRGRPGRKRSRVSVETDCEEEELPVSKRPASSGRKRKQPLPERTPSPPPVKPKGKRGRPKKKTGKSR